MNKTEIVEEMNDLILKLSWVQHNDGGSLHPSARLALIARDVESNLVEANTLAAVAAAAPLKPMTAYGDSVVHVTINEKGVQNLKKIVEDSIRFEIENGELRKRIAELEKARNSVSRFRD